MSERPAAAAGPLAPPPSPVDIGLVAAAPMEVAPLIARLSQVRTYKSARHKVVEGRLGDKLIAVVVAGMGRESGRRGAEILIQGHRPAWMLSAGWGGALDPSLRRDETVFATEVVDEHGGRFDLGLSMAPDTAGRFRPGRLLTVDAMVRTAAERAQLRYKYLADVVDMETSAVAAVCAARGVKLIALRVISDEAGADLPPELLAIVGPTGGYRIGAAIGSIMRRPGSLVELLRLREHGLSAADRLAEVVAATVARLP